MVDVEAYKALMLSFVEGEIRTEEFERRYIDAWLAEPGAIPEPLYGILEDVFESVECFDPEVTPETETRLDVSERTLRQDAADALKRLGALP